MTDAPISVPVLEERLRLGSQTMDKLERRIETLETTTKVKPVSVIAVISILIAIGTPLLTLAYAAGKYPDRYELEAARRQIDERLESIRVDIASLQRESIKVRTEVEGFSSRLVRLEETVDRLEKTLRRKP